MLCQVISCATSGVAQRLLQLRVVEENESCVIQLNMLMLFNDLHLRGNTLMLLLHLPATSLDTPY